MSMIVAYHFLLHGGVLSIYPVTQYFMPLVRGGVDIFVLITGFFMINLKYKGVIKLAVTIIIYQGICVLANYILTGSYIGIWHILVRLLAPLSKSDYWFINMYFCLMILSPILNYGLKGLDIHNLRKTVCLLLFITVYSCWIMQSIIGEGDNRLFNMIFLYVLGYYLRVEPKIRDVSTRNLVCTFVVVVFLDLCLNAWCVNHPTSILNGRPPRYSLYFSMSYYNPLLIVAHAVILILFSRLNFQSQIVNSIAGASLGVYLLQDGLLGQTVYGFQRMLWADGKFMEGLSLCGSLFCTYWLCSWLISKGLAKLYKFIGL